MYTDDCENCSKEEYCDSCYEKKQERIRRFYQAIDKQNAKQKLTLNLNIGNKHEISIPKRK